VAFVARPKETSPGWKSGGVLGRILKVEFMKFGLKQCLVRQMGLVLGDERWRQGTAERIFHDLIILTGARWHTD
jgi:hypothetical protein